MGLFDKNIIEKNLEYLPDPYQNMQFQLKRFFEMSRAYHDCPESIGPKFYTLAYDIKLDFENLLYKINRVRPSWWRGDFIYIFGYQVVINEHIDKNDGANLQVLCDFSGVEYASIVLDFYVPPRTYRELKILKEDERI